VIRVMCDGRSALQIVHAVRRMLESGKLKYRRDFVQVVGVAANDAMLDCQVDAAQLRLKLLLGRLLRILALYGSISASMTGAPWRAASRAAS
jgi:hypothetical protein